MGNQAVETATENVRATNQLEIPVERLKHVCNADELPFESTRELEALETTVGQHRGCNAIEFGLDIKSNGYNIFVSGPMGTGRNTTVNAYLEKLAWQDNAPPDWCYVHNFVDPYRPLAISLPSGKGVELARDMDEMIEGVKKEIPRAFEGETYEDKKAEVVREIQSVKEALLNQAQARAASNGFQIQTTSMGLATVPIAEGRPMTREEFDALSDEIKKDIQERGEQLQLELTQMLTKARKLDKEASERIRNLDKEVALFATGHLVEDLLHKYADYATVVEYVRSAHDDIVQNVDEFRAISTGADKEEMGAPLDLDKLNKAAADLSRYKINVLVNNCDNGGAPVVVEHSPTYYNLFGRIDYRARLGAMMTDFNNIKPGALHRANGGYLVVQARDLLTSPLSWDALKRALRSKEVRIENIGEQYSALPTASLRPEPIPLNVKVVVVGSPYIYYTLYHQDEDFRKLFKVKADFGTDMEWSDSHVHKYAAFISGRCSEDGLKHFHRSGVARVVEYGARLIENQDKLSTRFIDIADLVTEASYWASKNGSELVMGEHVDKAIEQKYFRSSLIEDRLQEMIDDGTIMIDVEGEVVGQVNGLAISDMGDYSFGKPSRITARTYVGSGGLVNIEREIQMSGRVHSKGFMILRGYLAGKYAQEKPLSLSASITFEQLYDEVDGDSASSTELYCLLSSLAGVPIKQSIAVTGSVNQRGEVQPVGGVTRKIEGFFECCKAKGLTGDQGVVIPHSNMKNLMLKDEVVQAVREGRFHIWAVRTIDEGLELLTGRAAGEPDAEGRFPEGSIHYLVDQRLHQFAEKMKQFDKSRQKGSADENDKDGSKADGAEGKEDKPKGRRRVQRIVRKS
ncbi:MAG: ATP-binding protein [Chloroflexota bacterium]|nr:MAG: ATP-binding protein [Chloroflexota bacterium]